jgi:glutamine synthetase
MLTDRGLWRIVSGVEAVQRFIDPKNVALFEKMGIAMIQQHIIPSCKNVGVGHVAELEKAIVTLKAGLGGVVITPKLQTRRPC